MAMQLGAFFPTRDMPADHGAIREWAQAAESIGFDFVEVPDHVLAVDRNALPDFEGPYDITDSFHETLVTLAFIAGVTTKIGLASGVLILPQRQTALVAKQTAQLDIVSNGRLRLGVGVGWNTEEYKALGEEWTTRGRRQAEQVELLQRMWTQRTVDFQGDFDSVHHLGLNPLPVQRPIPIWFGGSAEPVLRRAARFGQGWIPLGDPDELVKERLARLHTYLAENGRDPAEFGVEAWIQHGTGNADDWLETARAWQTIGASHLAFYTSGRGVGGVDKQIAAMQRFCAAMQDLGTA